MRSVKGNSHTVIIDVPLLISTTYLRQPVLSQEAFELVEIDGELSLLGNQKHHRLLALA